MSKRRQTGLGKGLGALIPTSAREATETDWDAEGEPVGLRMVAVTAIRPNPHQPRTKFDQAALEDLAASVAEHGLIQPLIVNREDNTTADETYTLIAGERRWRAAQLANLHEVPVIIKNVTPQAMLEMAIIENVQRADLNPLEEGLAYQQLVEEFGLTQGEVARRVGKSRPAITNTIRLLDLPPNVQQAVIDNQVSGGHARSLLSLSSAEQQTAVMNSIIQNGWSVRKTEDVVRKLLTQQAPPKKQQRRKPAEIVDLERRFGDTLGTRVSIDHGVNGGRLVIHYYSDEELNAIYEAIVGRD
ncbi:MAG: ParB/RepB/Spo0J family partition protein [Anaerolineae bacterium]|nr:ParB/RepB/Spo0J family partition protein [Anaerolineae bacterium]